jgi:2-aminobenzoate-CoA ligase
MVATGHADRPAIRSPGGTFTYRGYWNFQPHSPVLVEDLGLVPGNRVLLRGPNNR